METAQDTQDGKFDISASAGFGTTLAALGGSIVFTTYQCGKIFFIGPKDTGDINVFERSFPRAMGVAIAPDQRSFCLATKDRIYEFDTLLPAGASHEGHDAYYAPHQTWITGDLDVHDMAYDPNKTPYFCATLFNCIGKVERGYSFDPTWKPDFISSYAAEDRCHLNGFADVDGVPKYATCVAKTDSKDGWRAGRDGGGLVIDIATQKIIADGLSMPHSPRMHQGKLWILNSGTGHLGWIDTRSGTFTPITFCPGFARGLTFVGDHAIVGLSEPRGGRVFTGLPLQKELENHALQARCGLLIIDIKTGAIVDHMTIKGVVSELFDVDFLTGISNAHLVGIKGDDVQKTIFLKPSN